MRALQKIALLLVALAMPALADGEPAVVEQKRPLIYGTPNAAAVTRNADSETIDFEVVKTHTAGWKRLLVNLGLAHPFFQVKLSVQANGDDDAPVQETRWEFPTAYYFPADARDIEGDDVLVNVWRSFPVTARVKLKDGREKTVTKWIDPKAALARR